MHCRAQSIVRPAKCPPVPAVVGLGLGLAFLFLGIVKRPLRRLSPWVIGAGRRPAPFGLGAKNCNLYFVCGNFAAVVDLGTFR